MKDIEIHKYLDDSINKRDINSRFSSFDFCFNYFQNFENKNDIILPENIEKSCLHLGFYLASRGMYRGSSFLLQKSMKIYESLLKNIVTLDKTIWSLDVKDYKDNADAIIEAYNNIKKSIIPNKERDIVLVTKIMLGIFGCIPAYDQYFATGFKDISQNKNNFLEVNNKSLAIIHDFYLQNQEIIEQYTNQVETFKFNPVDANRKYTQAKIIDMIGFNYGGIIQTQKNMEKKKKQEVFSKYSPQNHTI